MNNTNRALHFKLREFALTYAMEHPDAPTTPQTLAVRIGVVRRTIKRYWHNEPLSMPSMTVLNKICRYYDCSLGDIVDFDAEIVAA